MTVNGVINVYKEKGFTSHDVVAKMRGILRMKKIGHTGTLDPDAEGVLPVCLGQGTKLCELLTDKTKTYRAGLLLGVETDTQDISGAVIAEYPVTAAPEEVREAIEGFAGIYHQLPPMYSALKVNGKRLYQLARTGKVAERQTRPVEISAIQIDSMEIPRVTFTVSCSKGTYIRTLCHDIGRQLGCGGCMEHLTRIRVGRFGIEESLRLADLERLRDEGRLADVIIPVDQMFLNLPAFFTNPEADKPVHNGSPLTTSQLEPERGIPLPEQIRVYDSQQKFIGIYIYNGQTDRYQPKKMFLGGD